MKKSDFIKKSFLSLLITSFFIITPFSNIVLSDDDIITEEKDKKPLEEGNDYENTSSSTLNLLEETEKNKELEQRLKEITDSNSNATDKAKELLSIYTQHIETQQQIANELSILKIELDTQKELLDTKNIELIKKETTLNDKEKELKETEKQLEKAKQQVVTSEKKLKDLDEEIIRKKEILKERMITLQLAPKNKNNSIIQIILTSDSFSETLRKIFALNELQRADNEFKETLLLEVKELEDLKKEQVVNLKKIETDSEKITVEYKQLEKDFKQLSLEKQETEKNYRELIKRTDNFEKLSNQSVESLDKVAPELLNVSEGMTSLLSELDDLSNSLDPEKNKKELETIANLKSEIESITNLVSNSENSRTLSKEKLSSFYLSLNKEEYTEAQQKLVERAEYYLGVPYVWGGTSPYGLDCSGLTQRIFREALGVEITRVTYTQQYQGEKVDLKDIQVGDLIFWGEPTYHVAIYVGDGYYIHAPQPGDVVKYSNYNITGASQIRRMVDYKK